MKYLFTRIIGIIVIGLSFNSVSADEFDDEQVKRWQQQFEMVASEGRSHWTDPGLGMNGVVCAQCHPNAADTHPETYPKFQKQLGRVALLWEMVNWCIRNTIEGKELAADDPKMIALLSYMYKERRGVKLEPGKH